jgi:hypothetical protein
MLGYDGIQLFAFKLNIIVRLTQPTIYNFDLAHGGGLCLGSPSLQGCG